jgi:hypothetical protein
MTTITWTLGRLGISALLVVLFAVASTVANAQTRIGTAQTVRSDASGSVAGNQNKSQVQVKTPYGTHGMRG